MPRENKGTRFMKYFKNFFNIYIRRKIFNKIFLSYTIFIVISFLILSQMIVEHMKNILVMNEIEYSKLVTLNLSTYLDAKRENVLNITKSIYSSNRIYPNVIQFLESSESGNSTSLSYITLKNTFDGYIDSFFSQDPDIANILVYQKNNNTIYHYSTNFVGSYDASDFDYYDLLDMISDKRNIYKLYPSKMTSYKSSYNDYIYTLVRPINTLSTNRSIGLIFFDFKINGIKEYLTQYGSNLSGNIYILTEEGEVIYDSTNTYYGKIYPFYNEVMSQSRCVINDKDSLISVNTNNKLKLSVVNVIPMETVLTSLYSLRDRIYLMTFMVCLVTLFLSTVCTQVFSKRIRTIVYFMKNLQLDNLSQKIPTDYHNDELSDIIVSFNKMQDQLQTHLEQVYIASIHQKNAELKQRSAELFALQTQINPHFLYNTLEAIRMKTINDGDDDAGKMILILSKLFRSTVKEGTFIDIYREITIVKQYLELFKIRYGDRLSTIIDVNPEIYLYKTLKHTLQPIIENYILHGFNSSKSDSRIAVTGYLDGEFVFFRIEDNGSGISEEKLNIINQSLINFDMMSSSSIGLANINERIKITFGPDSGLTVKSQEGCGTTVIVKILKCQTEGECFKCIKS